MKFSREQLLSVFGPGAGAKSNRLAIENPSLWRAMRQEAISENILTAQPRDAMRAVREGWDAQAKPREYSQVELHARGKWSKEACIEAANKNWAEMAKDDPRGFAEFQLARASYGLPSGKTIAELVTRVEELSLIPEPIQPEAMFALSESLARAVGLEPGTKVPEQTFRSAIAASERLREEQERKAISKQAQRIIEQENAAKNN